MYKKLVNCIMYHEIRSRINYIRVKLPVVKVNVRCVYMYYILSFFKLFSHLPIILIYVIIFIFLSVFLVFYFFIITRGTDCTFIFTSLFFY
jgi:hypothetical protein